MRRSQRLTAAAVLISLSGVLAGCSDSLSNWDPSDFSILSTPRKRFRANASRYSPKACRASNRACRSNCTRARRRNRSISRTPQQRPLLLPRARRNRSTRNRRAIRRPRPRLRMPQQRKTVAPTRHPRLPSPRKLCASAPPRRRRISKRRSRRLPVNQRSRRSNPPRHSRRRCRAVPSRDRFSDFIRLRHATIQ